MLSNSHNTATLTKNKPLFILRQEQYHALLFCWRIRTGLKKDLEPSRLKRYVDWFYINNLGPHFEIEEIFIFPLIKNNTQLIKKARSEHRRLKRLIADTANPSKTLSLLEEELESYFLFERQKLLYEIQTGIPEKELDIIAGIHMESISYDDWGDEFWR
ncbi:MAG: hemerythrin domain-containing protein [Bacteroidia bacterium]|nr:hemerythrin domain-containing protein [Bacteroidia bacterium]